MGIGEIIYSLITLILMVLIMFSPLLRKMMKAAEKNAKGEVSDEDSIYESVDSHRVVQRVLADNGHVPHIEFTEPAPLAHVIDDRYEEKQSVGEKLDRMTVLKKAVIWKEILDKPVGLKDWIF